MDEVRGKIRLRGDFEGNRDADIQFKFRFCDDGVYYYVVEQVGIWRLAMRGHFEIRGGVLDSSPSGRKVVRMTPAVVDVDCSEPYVAGMLSERGLPGKATEDYYLRAYEYKHAVNPNIKLRQYCFWIPDASGISTRDWMIKPMKG